MEKYRAIPEGYMRIGEIAKKAGITVRTLSFYDKEGLLSPSAESEGGYRLYTNKDMVQLIQILMLKQLGLPLSEIKNRMTQLDTPQDVIAMLQEQATQVRNKIESLKDSVEAMEILSEEIAQMETVNFKKYADILLNLQVKSESYRMIKYFDDETLDMFRERIGREKAALMTATIYDLYEDATELIAESQPPEGDKAQAFAAMLWNTMVELSGGDIDMMLKLSAQMEKASRLEYKNGSEERIAVRNFMNQALKIYHKNTDIGTDKIASVIKFTTTSSDEAYELHSKGISPESEEAQQFAKAFWETILEITDGNVDLLMQMSEESKNITHQDEKLATANRFTEAALEVYFKAMEGEQHD